MKLHILSTGGTIDKIYFDANSDFEVGDPVVSDLLKRLDARLDFEVEPLMRKDSLDLTDADRDLIRDRVINCDADHVLITHGTDTMVQTAKSLLGISHKRIVLTGALQPAAFSKTDAIFNIGCAIGAVQSKPPGVYIAMNGLVFDGDKVVKNREQNCFQDEADVDG